MWNRLEVDTLDNIVKMALPFIEEEDLSFFRGSSFLFIDERATH